LKRLQSQERPKNMTADSPDSSEPTDLVVSLDRVRRIARLWDEAVRIPVLGWRVGLDALVGLVPGIGDVVGLIASLYPLVIGAQLGAGPAVVLRMAWNILLDATVGAIPILGDLFDVAWKANARNRDLLERWARDPNRVSRSSGATLAVVGLGAAALLVLTVWSAVRLIVWLVP
jgi:hypothetical protein